MLPAGKAHVDIIEVPAAVVVPPVVGSTVNCRQSQDERIDQRACSRIAIARKRAILAACGPGPSGDSEW